MQRNEDKNGIEGELPFASDATKSHIPKKYIIPCYDYLG
jgi:hypothetical protein